MTNPATARVGMKRHGFALHYFDCQTLRDVVFEVWLWRTGCLKRSRTRIIRNFGI